MAELRIHDLSFSHGAFALSGVNLHLAEGERVALLGASGSGKSTLLKLIAGFLPPQAGEILIGGERVAGKGTFVPPHRRGVGLVFQQYALFPHMSVEKNILFGCKAKDKHAEVQLWLERLRISHLAKRYPHEISGGEQQRVALARALIAQPRVLLMDEPFANLDTELRAHVREECAQILAERNVTTLLVTHDRFEAETFAGRCYSVKHGRLV